MYFLILFTGLDYLLDCNYLKFCMVCIKQINETMIGKGTSENSNEERAKKEEFLRETFLKSMAEAGFQLRGKESEGGGVGSATTTTNGVSNKLGKYCSGIF